MKKKYKVLLVTLLFTLMLPFSVYADELFPSEPVAVSCDGLFTPEALSLVRDILGWFRILAPCLLVVLVGVDFAKAVISQDDKMLAKATSNVSKRAIATLCVIFTPTMVIAFSKIAAIDSVLGSDPLCTNATGTAAKEKARVAEKQRNPEFTWEGGVIHTSHGGGGGSFGGSGTFGPGNESKRSYMTYTYAGRTYDMYNQGGLTDISYQSGNLAMYGCAPIAFASAVSGFDSSIGAYEAAKMCKSRSFSGIMGALDSVGVKYSGPYYYNSNNHDDAEVSKMAAMVREHFATGPVIALVTGDSAGQNKYATNNHFITLLGEENGEVIISNCVSSKGNLEEIISQYMRGGRKGVLLVG